MAVVRKEFANNALNFPIEIQRDSDESASNTDITVSTTTGRIRRLLYVTFIYTGSSSTTLTVTLNSGAGANWDIELDSNTLSSATDYTYFPIYDVIIGDDDIIDAKAPALTAQTAAVAIYTQAL